MKINAESLKKMIRDEGIDLVGIADAENLVLAHPERPATALMPTAKSVIVMAVAHTLGSVFSPDIMLWTRSKMQTSRILDATAEKISRILEKEGFLTLPVSSDKPVEIHKFDPETGKKFSQTKVIGHFSHKHAAISCGMGEIGESNLLLTPEFGPHQRLCAIITELELEPDPAKELAICKQCGRCRKACPSGALRSGTYDVDPCFNYWTYGFTRTNPTTFREWGGFMKMLLKHRKKRDLIIETGQIYITDVDNCIECMWACPTGSRWEKIRPEKTVPQKSSGRL